MVLSHFASAYADRVEASAGHRHQLASVLRSLGDYLHTDPQPEHLTETTVNGYIAWLRARGRSDSYRRGRLTYLLILWRELADDGVIPPPRRKKVTRVRVADRITRTMTREQVQQLLATAEARSGSYRHGITRAGFWGSYICTAWDTGLRGCDQTKLRTDSLTPRGTIVMVQAKTGKRLCVQVRPATVERIRATMPPHRPLIWPLWASAEMFRREAAELFADAGMPQFSLSYIRSAAGTAVERSLGAGHEFLGNTRKVFEQHYLDETQLDPHGRMPPPLD
jgi:integrase